ncbi:hypothetical protein HUK65_18175 [Rhodobacteraceae bacterium 2376]|uniref:Uncharacterized protein n=1 Tax=Rhabdonatronobacter sediminivivens TaxID=2743469 RepID=A0A7Z0L044_9RHOB|nr:hypothetical protein [Rhabdonatronobacter sediminivivens]NYS26885.1 hypothetical protein [Rhabdonatronobacter sediminivivens]
MPRALRLLAETLCFSVRRNFEPKKSVDLFLKLLLPRIAGVIDPRWVALSTRARGSLMLAIRSLRSRIRSLRVMHMTRPSRPDVSGAPFLTRQGQQVAQHEFQIPESPVIPLGLGFKAALDQRARTRDINRGNAVRICPRDT